MKFMEGFVMKPILLTTVLIFCFTGICVAADDKSDSASRGITGKLLAFDKSKPVSSSKDEGWQPLNAPEKPTQNPQPASGDGFQSTSGGMTESLLSPDKGDSSGSKAKESEWQPLNSVEPPKTKTRSIKVLKKEKGIETWETVKAPEKRTGGFVNLKIEFDVNSYTIRPESYKLLDELGKAISDPRLADRIIIVNGHTDSDGKEKYNVRLSLNRADAVKQYLIDHQNVSPERLKVVGYGESMPLKPNTSKENKQLNRRVEIVAKKK
jgi:outer membrane protein OmpA-like peptidoglycan-associated protein